MSPLIKYKSSKLYFLGESLLSFFCVQIVRKTFFSWGGNIFYIREHVKFQIKKNKSKTRQYRDKTQFIFCSDPIISTLPTISASDSQFEFSKFSPEFKIYLATRRISLFSIPKMTLFILPWNYNHRNHFLKKEPLFTIETSLAHLIFPFRSSFSFILFEIF